MDLILAKMRGGYNRHYLKRVKMIQEINREWEGGFGRTYAWVWRNKVYPVYPCHYHTYLNMMGINVAQELKRLEQREMEACGGVEQLKLF